MPKVVSDAGPLIHLTQINKLHLIRKLFRQATIIPEVKKETVDEGIRLGHADARLIGKAIEEGWIIVEEIPHSAALAAKRLAKDENISLIDAKTLILARENQAEMLVDEKPLSDLAKMFSLKTWNTWTILLESLRRGLIEMPDIESAIAELGKKRHKLKERQAVEILKAAKLIASHK